MNPETSALPVGLPIPVPESDGLSKPFWEALTRNVLLVQRCGRCARWQWGPEWICHACHSFDMVWEAVEPKGRIYVSERIWHPVHAVLKDATPYLAVLVELPQAGNVRLLGNLLGDPMAPAPVGMEVRGVFDHRVDGERAYSLLNWQRAS